jgi:hypothetical protein
MSSRPPNRHRRIILLGGFAVGLLLRVLMLSYKGTFDMDTNAAWGRAVVREGLAHAYAGNYFPLAYQLFGAIEWLASRLGVGAIPVYKAANLAFDVGTFWVLVALLKQSRGGPLVALIYWLHPWFLSVFSLGYVDSHFTFFLVLWLWLVRDATTVGQYFLAGIPLALALMLKPQAVLPVAGVLVYLWFRRRDRTIGQTAYVLAPAVLVFAAYELYFAAALFPERGIDALLLLPASYARIGSIQPVLTAHMPNIWYVVAYVLKPGGQDIWNVSSKMHLLPFVQTRFFALVLTLGVITWYAHLLAGTRSSRPNGSPFFYLTAFTALAVPMLMTSAHENHLFLATVLMIPLLASRPGPMAAAAIHGTLVLQCLNLELIYGLNSVVVGLRVAYTAGVRLAVAIISVVLSGVIVWRLFAAAKAKPEQVIVTDRNTEKSQV